MQPIIAFYSAQLAKALEKHDQLMLELSSEESRMKEIHRYSMEVEELTARFERDRSISIAA